jgi:hypothetical protein
VADSPALVRAHPPVWRTLIVFLCAAGLFLSVNQAGYRAWFYGDDLATFTWARSGSVPVFLSWLISPRVSDANFRPVGAFYYRILAGWVGLSYPPYVAVIQAVHLLNVALLYLFLRRLKLSWFASIVGAAFFLFHVATVDVYWKPMYVFDLLCGTFCLAALVLYADGRWILSLVAFWLAFKSKEIAILLPAVLAFYEWLFGARNWKRLIPFAAVSLNFGLQGFFSHLHTADSYTFRFTPADLATTVTYYASELLFNPYVLLAALPLFVLVRDRRFYFGALLALLILFPLLLLPGRLFSAYWYVPLAGVSVMIAVLSDRSPRWLVVSALAFWMAGNYGLFLRKEREILAAAADNRTYFQAVTTLASRDPSLRVLGYQDYPQEMYMWGAESSVTLAFGFNAKVYPMRSAEWQASSRQPDSCLLQWQQDQHRLIASCEEPQELHSTR